MKDRPHPHIGQRWRLNRLEGVIVQILPGGGGDMGVAVFDGNLPPTHASTMTLALPVST